VDRFLTENAPAHAGNVLGGAKRFLALLVLCLPILALEQVDCSSATDWRIGGGTASLQQGGYSLGAIVRFNGKVWKCISENYWSGQEHGQPGGANSATYWTEVECAGAAIPTVNSVAISPKTANVEKSKTQAFTANVSVAGGATGAVDWGIVGNANAGTSLSGKTNTGATLTVVADETATSIKVWVKSTEDDTKSDTAVVTILAAPAPAVNSVTISPKTSEVLKGATLQFNASVSVEGGASQTVTWSVSGNISASTKIDANTGLLSVASDETAATLKVKAVSTYNSDKYDEATITVSSTAIAGSITSVTISPKIQSVEVGNTLNLSANVIKTGEYTGNVSWGIVGATASLLSNESGSGATLNVSAGETAVSIKVWVKSTEDQTKSDSATITITAPLASVEITPKNASVKKGETLDLTASVIPANAPQGVDWKITGSSVSTISSSGKLTVPVGETASEINVIATSKINVDKSDTAVITIQSADKYRVTIDCGPGGTTNPSEYVDVEEGGSVTISFTPNTGYEVDGVWVNGNARTKPLAGWAPITINGINSSIPILKATVSSLRMNAGINT